MIIGEGPGKKESETGYPFVGLSGQLLQKALVTTGLKKNQLFIANVVKHRPPANRTPTKEEMLWCSTMYLHKQIVLVQPKQIVCVGKTATTALAALQSLTIPKSGLRGYTFNYDILGQDSIPVLSTWHPAYILRNRKKLPELLTDLTIAFANAKVCSDTD